MFILVWGILFVDASEVHEDCVMNFDEHNRNF